MYDGLVLCLTAFDVVPPKKQKNFGMVNCVRRNFFAAKQRKFYFEKWPVINNLNGYLYHFLLRPATFPIINAATICSNLHIPRSIRRKTFIRAGLEKKTALMFAVRSR